LEHTENALTSAEQERDRAERSLSRYLKEKEYASALLDRQSEDTTERTVFLVNEIILNESLGQVAIEKAMDILDKALATNPPKNQRIWSLKAYLLFITQRFVEAEKFYKIRVGDQRELRALIPEFSLLVRNDGLLPPADFIRLMRRLTKTKDTSRTMLVEKMVIYDSLKRESYAEKAQIAKAVIKLANPQWKQAVFSFDTKRKHLKIGGQGLRQLHRPNVVLIEPDDIPLCMLRVLNLRSLDLRAVQLRNLYQLDGLQLHELDVSKMPAKNLAPLAKMKSLRLLKVRRGQYGKSQLELLPKQVTVKVVGTAEN